MSLRFRLNLAIAAIFAVVLLAGTVVVIQKARQAVATEIQSIANLAGQLLELALQSEGADQTFEGRVPLMSRISEFEKARHLHIELVEGSNRSILTSQAETSETEQAQAPGWFVGLVEPSIKEMRRAVQWNGMRSAEIVIRPDPSDEIAETWEEARSLLGLLVLFLVLANTLVFVTIGRALRPVDLILHGLQGIELGNYRSRLPSFRLPELEAIADKFNHMAEVLERSREETRFLTQRSLAIQEEERRHLAHELHDEMGQSISAIKAFAISIGQRDTQDKAIEESANTIAEISSHLYDVVRSMMRRLRPVVLDELGLVPALIEIIDRWNQRHKDVFCRFHAGPDVKGLSEDIEITLYRIVQECLTNIAKHAHASEVEISLICRRGDLHETSKRSLRLKVSDDGVGMDPRITPWGLGLLGMRERVQALNGTFEFRANPSVTVAVDLPLSAQRTGR